MRALGMFLYGIAGVVGLAGVGTAVQMTAHTAAWQQAVLIIVVVAIAAALLRLGRRLRRPAD